MAQKTLSILCSIYNSAPFLAKYCRSLNAQLLCRFHVVFVDAASTDNSLSIVEGFQFREGITTTVLKCASRVSVYEAWNKGIQATDSDYCMNYNTDDHLYPAALSTMMEYASNCVDVDVFYSRSFIVSTPEHDRLHNIFDWPELSHSTLLKQCICGPFPLLKREAVVRAGLFDTKYVLAGDYELWLRMSKSGCFFKKIPETIGSYYVNPKGLSTDPALNQQRNREVLEIQGKYQ